MLEFPRQPLVSRRAALRGGVSAWAGLSLLGRDAWSHFGSDARLVLVAGGGSGGTGIPATEAKLTTPFGVAFDRAGNMILVEHDGHRILKVDREGLLTLIGGTGKEGGDGDGGPATKATFNHIHNVAVAKTGAIYLADTRNNRVRMIDGSSGTVTTVAGTGRHGFSGDGGPATEAEFGAIYCASLDPAETKLYLTDLDNRRIRAVDLECGVVTTVAGNGEQGVPKDGRPATDSPFVDPRAAIADAEGRIYILERSGNALRMVDTDGSIHTLAGTGEAGHAGDGGPALVAMLNGPKHLCLDYDGSVLIADTENHTIRRYSPKDKTIDRVAGTGRKGDAGLDGPPLEAELAQPHGVCIGPDGAVYISDSTNNRVVRIERRM